MNAATMQSVTALQARLDEIDRGIKATSNFMDGKAYVMDESGKKILLSRQEMYEMRGKIEQQIKKLV